MNETLRQGIERTRALIGRKSVETGLLGAFGGIHVKVRKARPFVKIKDPQSEFRVSLFTMEELDRTPR
jgi:hypothetical protein